ncbi:MAG: hypothetical protein R6U61_03265 [Thermoplasmata archaeon]
MIWIFCVEGIELWRHGTDPVLPLDITVDDGDGLAIRFKQKRKPDSPGGHWWSLRQ